MRVGSFKRVIARLAVVMVAIGAPAMVTATPAQAQYVSVTKYGVLFNFARAQSLSLTYHNFSNDVVMNRAVRQVHLVLDSAPNGHTIRVAGYCLDSNAAGNVYELGCSAGVNKYQRWHFNATGVRWATGYDGDPSGNVQSYEIINTATGRCLDADLDVYTLPCNGGDHQRWFIR